MEFFKKRAPEEEASAIEKGAVVPPAPPIDRPAIADTHGNVHFGATMEEAQKKANEANQGA